MVLREEGLALGANSGNETFGLDAFQGLLGRLNGKSGEALRKEEEARRKVQIKIQQERRLGSLRFVSAGFLRMDEDTIRGRVSLKAEQAEAKVCSKKRKRSEDDQPDPILDSAFKPKKSKKRKRPSVEELAQDILTAIDALEEESPAEKSKSKQKQKKSAGDVKKKPKKRKATPTELEEPQSSREQDGPPGERADAHDELVPQQDAKLNQTKKERRKRKVEKKVERAERRARKEARRMKKARAASERLNNVLQMDPPTENTQTRTKDQRPEPDQSAPTEADGPSDPPVQQLTNPPLRARGRHLIRQRYIQQKNMATLDEKALNEIFMIKARA